MHFVAHLAQIFQIFLLCVWLDFIHCLDCLSLDVGVFSLDLQVRNLDVFLVFVLQVDYELVDGFKLAYFDCVIDLARKVRVQGELLDGLMLS